MTLVESTDPNPARTSAAIAVRRISFADPLEDLPKHFAKDRNIVTSHLMVQLSVLFPEGEDFFVRSVRAFRDQITDPVLQREVASFIGQESVHGREHREMNDKFAMVGYPNTRKVERRLGKRLKIATETLPAIQCLAATAAIEHFTAVLAEVLLGTGAQEELGHPGIQSIFLWHALEESEHKAVAFDVYRAVGGSEKMRRKTMRVIRRTFIGRVLFMTIVSLVRDPVTYQRGRLWRDLKSVLKTPLVDKAVWSALCDYDRLDFHPNDHETDHLIDPWREELFGAEGTLTAHLSSAQRST